MSDIHALIIDDNRLNIQVLAMLLENQGVTVTAVDSARSVPDALATMAVVDIVFLDLEFPNSNGFDMLKTLETVPLLKDVPIVAYTVHTSEIDLARQAGFHSFLGKPLQSTRFPDQLRRILSGERIWEA